MQPLTIFVVAGPASGASCTVEKDKCCLGRIKTGNALALKDSAVSAKHLQLAWQEGHWHAIDQGSSNGTKVRSQACQEGEKYVLHSGDQLMLGPSTIIMVMFEEPASAEVTLEQKLLADAESFASLMESYAETMCGQLMSSWQQQKQRLLDSVAPPPPPAAAGGDGL